jgi:hypothetical protein
VALVPFPSQNRHDDEQNLPAKPGGFSPFGDDEEPVGEGRMTFLEHLDELRKRITHAVGGLLVGFIIAFAFINDVFNFIYARLALVLQTFGVTEFATVNCKDFEGLGFSRVWNPLES